MRLKLTLKYPDGGMWDGGPKTIFYYEIHGRPQTDSKGTFVKVGSYERNVWFHVAVGKTEKITLANIKRRVGKFPNNPHTWEYVADQE